MALIADTSGIVALYDAGDRHHKTVRRTVEEEEGSLVVPATILGEVDSMLRTRVDPRAAIDFVKSLGTGAFTLELSTPADLARCAEIMSAYRKADIGLADASIIALAERTGIVRVLTLDERDFRPIRLKGGRALLLLPADA